MPSEFMEGSASKQEESGEPLQGGKLGSWLPRMASMKSPRVVGLAWHRSGGCRALGLCGGLLVGEHQGLRAGRWQCSCPPPSSLSFPLCTRSLFSPSFCFHSCPTPPGVL